MTRNIFTLVLFCFISLLQAQPFSFTSKGIGGGGALFSPSINPANHNEFYVGCDMGELFHTSNYGISYDQLNFINFIGGHSSKVNYTNISGLLYSISYINEIATPVKSVDNGVSWNILPGNPEPSENTNNMFVDYENPSRILISYYGNIFFSSNGGTTFSNIHNALDNGAGVVLAGVLFDSNNLYIGTNDGVLVSTNGGNNWTITNITGLPANEKIWSFAGAKSGNITRFFCITADVNDLYVGVVGSDYWGFAKGIYSVDYGDGYWTSKISGINLSNDFPMFVDMATNDIQTVYLAGSNNNSYPDIIKSTNAGGNWTHVFNTANNQNITTGWSGFGGDRGWGYGECPFGFDVAANDPNVLIFSDYGFVHTSQNGGTTWSQAYVDPANQNPAGVNTPPYQSYSSSGIENTSCWQVHWIDQNNIWGCFSDIKGIRSIDQGNHWSFNYTGHAANTSYRIAQLSSGTLLAATSNIHDIYQSTYLQDSRLDVNDINGKIIYSTNSGQTWQNLKVFNHPVYWIEVDPNNENIAYASVIHYNNGGGIGGIYRTTNLNLLAGSTWTLLPNPPRTEKHPAALKVLNDGKMVCTYSGRRNASGTFTASSGVFLYDPVNKTWTDLSHAGMLYWTKDIIIDPKDTTQNTWYVGVFSGWGGPPNGLGGLYKTTNRGQTWTKLTGNTLDRVHSCTFNPQNPNQLFITTEIQGLWKSDNINAPNPTFSIIHSYPFQQPVRVFFNPYDATEMWVSSFGNGMRKGRIFPSGCNMVDNTNNSGIGSLRYAIECANAGDTIFFNNTLVGDTIRLNGSPMVLQKSITILNQNSGKVNIKHTDGNLFVIQKNTNVWMENIHLITAASNGICVENSGTLACKDVNTSGINGTISRIININNGEIVFTGTNIVK